MKSEFIIPQNYQINKKDRNQLFKHRSFVVWLTGLSGSGKSTLANLLEQQLYQKSCHTFVLDGDNIRGGLNKDLSFSTEDRIENIRRIGEVAKLMVDAGLIVITAFVSPFRQDRELVRNLLEKDEFIEVFVHCPLEICEQRDVKGLYQKARAGLIKDFTGITSPFEEPLSPEVKVNSHLETQEESLNHILNFIQDKIR